MVSDQWQWISGIVNQFNCTIVCNDVFVLTICWERCSEFQSNSYQRRSFLQSHECPHLKQHHPERELIFMRQLFFQVRYEVMKSNRLLLDFTLICAFSYLVNDSTNGGAGFTSSRRAEPELIDVCLQKSISIKTQTLNIFSPTSFYLLSALYFNSTLMNLDKILHQQQKSKQLFVLTSQHMCVLCF